ncbi:mediator of RNA polymerase II transcription subunit 15-like isoform X3 [Amphibalanus amphitrite]|nr:mediator of RNA polymerase II transcription subunit 15-like isoform X3 [Amphibalanus amphitrite]XP_043235069.1 mediator of RNA polymerase II transcription subunit 15-like isoform X3 [Amphibalanus amphitrite]XP_043235071.1 mediator of RNA polymerase II transcription subunit 15-like isoform X3 [Amphibalanus amphitrite]
MEDSMDAGFLADLPKDGGALAALERLDTPPPTPIFLSELESSPLSSAGLESPLGDSELEPPGADQDTMTMDDLLNSCGVSCDASVDSPLLSSLDLMWGASPTPALTAATTAAPTPSPAPAHTPSSAPRTPEPSAAPAGMRSQGQEKSAGDRPAPPTPEQQLQAEVQRLHRQQRQEEATKQLLERQLQQLQKQQLIQQRQDQQQQQLLIKQQKQAQRQQQRQKQHLHWQQHQLQQRQTKQQQQQQQRAQQQHRLRLDDSSAKSSASTSSSTASSHQRGPAKVRRKTRVITIPSSAGPTTVTVPHIVICTPSIINSRPSATSLPVTFSVQDRQTAAARVTARPTVTFSAREQGRPLGVGLGVGVRRRVVGRAAPGSVPIAKRYSVESSPSSPETPPCSLLRIPSRQKPVLKVTTATQTGEAVDEVLRNNDSTLIRLLVTGQDLTNGYKLCPDGQCLTPERQPAPPSLFAGLPDRGSSVLLSMLSHDDEPQLPALFPSETAGRLLDDPL